MPNKVYPAHSLDEPPIFVSDLFVNDSRPNVSVCLTIVFSRNQQSINTLKLMNSKHQLHNISMNSNLMTTIVNSGIQNQT